MVFRLYLLGFLLILPIAFFSQKENKPQIEIPTIEFSPDPENANYYFLSVHSNSKDLFGTVNFYNTKGSVIFQMYEIEIAFNPGYHIIDISEFPKGEIKIETFIDDVPIYKIVQL